MGVKADGRLRRTSLVDAAQEELNRRIADGVIAPGERLVIDRLAADFGTSLIPVREALARLHAEKIVVFEPNRGYRVAPEPTPAQVERMFEMRIVLETGAVRLGVARVTPAMVGDLGTINREIARGRYGTTFEGLRAFVRANQAFHERLVALADNPYLAEAYRQLGYHQQTFRFNHGRGIPDLDRIVAEHAAIIEALLGGDVEKAADALARHIRDGYERLASTRAEAPHPGAPRQATQRPGEVR